MALALGVPVTHAAKPIVVEAEGLHFPEGWRVVDADYLAGTPCSENGMLRYGPGEAEDKVKLLHKIDVSGFGVWCGLRLGNLNGDNRLDIVLAQNQGQSITCLTAIDIDGRKLWQVGRPDPGNHKTSFDLPVQIYDMDRDGTSEVICVMDDKLKILSGKSGAIEKEAPLPSNDARDCIVIGNFSGNEHPQDILVKNRYGKVWALDQDLEVMWSHKGNTGHYPWPHDFDGDGRDELMCGFALLGHDGAKKWEAKLPGHSDATAVGEVDGNPENGPEIALATCGGNTFALLSSEGKMLWRRPLRSFSAYCHRRFSSRDARQGTSRARPRPHACGQRHRCYGPLYSRGQANMA